MDPYTFARKIEEEIQLLSEKEYILRKPIGPKKLREEKWPIARLALALKQPGIDIDVQAFDDNGEFDGLIVESGFRERRLPIQVTFCYTYEESLHDEELVTTGFSFGAGPIQRKKNKKIESIAGAVDMDEHIEALTEEIIRKVNKKIAKGYSTKMILIVALSHYRLTGIHQWSALLSKIKSKTELASDKFISMYIFNDASNEIYRFV